MNKRHVSTNNAWWGRTHDKNMDIESYMSNLHIHLNCERIDD